MCVSVLLLALSAGGNAQPGVIDPQLQTVLGWAAPDEELPVIVRFADGVDVRDGELRKALGSVGARDVVVLWIIRGIAAKVPVRAIPELARLPGVANIRLDEPVTLPRRPASVGGDPTVATEPPPDSVAPSVPAGVTVTDTTQTTATLAWQASTDNVGVTGYRLYEHVWVNRHGWRWVLQLDGVVTLSIPVTGLTPGSLHRYAVSAVDAGGNESAGSAPVELRTLQPPRAYHPVHVSTRGVFAIVGEPFAYDAGGGF